MNKTTKNILIIFLILIIFSLIFYLFNKKKDYLFNFFLEDKKSIEKNDESKEEISVTEEEDGESKENINKGEEDVENLDEEDKKVAPVKELSEKEKQVMLINEIYEEAKNNSDVKICLEMEDIPNRDSCIKNIAILNKSISDCSSIDDDLIKQECEDYVQHKLAQKNKDLSECLKISDSRLSWSCISFLVNTKEDCVLLPSDLQSDCLDLVNMRNFDCENISSSELKQECQTIPN